VRRDNNNPPGADRPTTPQPPPTRPRAQESNTPFRAPNPLTLISVHVTPSGSAQGGYPPPI